MTKKELEDHVKNLRELLTKAQTKIEELTTKKQSDNVNNNHPAVGALYDDVKRRWNLVILGFNPETQTAEVKDIKDVGDSYDMLRYRMEEFIATNVLLPANRK